MGKLFGTDGIRGIVNKDLTFETAIKTGASVARVLKKELNKENLTFIIGGDTRISKDVISAAVTAGVLSEGCNVIDVGVMPTPGISYLTNHVDYRADGAFVISASHNPAEYNGIKVLNQYGYKLSEELEEECEKVILGDFEFNSNIIKLGKYKYMDLSHEYYRFLHNNFSANYQDITKIKPLIDLANGAACNVAPMLFPKYFNRFQFMHNIPDGFNINQNAGSTDIESLKKEVVSLNYDIGIAFDGDADRCILVDENGNEVDGDFILAIIGNYLKEKGKLNNNTIVGTLMSNMGLVKFCEERGINFVRTDVGDKYVLKEMMENGYNLGGEQSGHIILSDYANTGDGMLTAIMILNIMAETHLPLSELASIMTKYPQVHKKVKACKEQKEAFKTREDLQKYVEKLKKDLGDDYYVVIRPSGTENVIRVTIQGKDTTSITNVCDDIVSYLSLQLSQDPFVRKRK